MGQVQKSAMTALDQTGLNNPIRKL